MASKPKAEPAKSKSSPANSSAPVIVASTSAAAPDSPTSDPKPQGYEAKGIEVAGCTFIGSQAAVAFVGSVGCHVHHNTIVHPERWALRILQETREKGFVPCQKGRFENNLLVANEKLHRWLNIGSGTDPKSFQFNGNLWWDESQKQPKPNLPDAEKDPIYLDPAIELGDKITLNSKAKELDRVGHWAWKEK